MISFILVKSHQIPISVGVRRICGILGSIKLIGGLYLVVATHREFVGLINNHAIWRLAGFDLIPYANSLTHLSTTQITQNESYLSMVRQMLDTPYYYFSYTYDLTHTLQRLHSMPQHFLNMGLADRADPKFLWNGSILKSLQKPDTKKYCLPIMMGCKLTYSYSGL